MPRIAVLGQIGLLSAMVLVLTGSGLASGFAPPVIYPADQGPNFVTIGAFNRDGKTDLAVTNLLSNDVSVLIGNGDGTFQPAVNYPVGISPTGVTELCSRASLHVENLAVVNSGSDTVSVLIGNGDGTFQPAVEYSLGTGKSPRAVLMGDFNLDGSCDLAIANASGGSNNNGNIAILLGNGDGTLGPASNYDTLGVEPVALTVGGYNNDVFSDLAVANFASNSVTIFLGNGQGGFTASGDYPTGVGPSSITGFFESSSALNLVTANSGSNNITELYGADDGTFPHSKNLPVGTMPVSLTVGIFNQSNILLDIAVANEGDSTISALLGQSKRPYLRKPATFATCSSPQSVVTIDANLDGKEDLVVACAEGVGVMLNTGP